MVPDMSVLVHPEEDWFPPMEVGGDPGRNLVASEKNGYGDVDAVIATTSPTKRTCRSMISRS